MISNNDFLILEDDNKEKLNLDIELNTVRIGCIQKDGNGFLHALLKSFYLNYANINNTSYRMSVVSFIRKSFASLLITNLETKNIEKNISEGHIYYDDLENGSYSYLASKGITILDINNEDRIDFRLSELHKLLMSDGDLSAILFSPIARFVGIKYYLVSVDFDRGKLFKLMEGGDLKAKKVCLLLPLSNWSSYELIGFGKEGSVRVLFDLDSSELKNVF